MSLGVEPFAGHQRLAERAAGVLSLSGHPPSGRWSVVGPLRLYRGSVASAVQGLLRGRAEGWRCVLTRDGAPAGLLDFDGAAQDSRFMLRDRNAGRVYADALALLTEQLEDVRARFEVRVIHFPDLFVTALWAKASRQSFFVPTRLPRRERPEPALLRPPAFRAHILAALRNRARAASNGPSQAAAQTNRLDRGRTRLGLGMD